jgi:CRISPR system Cascade subunit CasE
MYLSRLILNPRCRRVQREIADPYQMHKSLMRAFPDGLKKGDERVLFRLEPGRNGALTLLVQSWTLPDWSWLTEPNARDYLLPALPTNQPSIHQSISTKPFDLHLAPGQVLAFRLRANPTVKRWYPNEEGEKRPKRVGLYREEEQIEWLKRKGQQGGFRLFSVRTGGQDVVNGDLYRGDTRHQLKLLAVQFDGLLQVTDPDRLREMVRQGVGSGKGLGFGLLSLARPT